MTVSTKCKCGKPRKSGGRYCLDCHAAYMREHRPKHSELPDEQRKKANARALAKHYVKNGTIKRETCLICGEKAEMHHDDYDKPLEIIWFCRKHHLEHHRFVVKQSMSEAR